MLESLQLSLQSARDSKHLQVQRRSSLNSGRKSPTPSSSWTFPRPFEEFEALHRRLVLALQHGHFCSASCPWLFSFLTSGFPKKHIFQRSSSLRAVEARREKLLELLTSTLEFLLDMKNHACTIATTDVAKLTAEFLYGEDAVAQFIVESYSEAESSTTNNSNRRHSLGVLYGEEESAASQNGNCSGEFCDLTTCGVCNGPLACEADTNKSSASPVNSRTRRRSSVYTTVLQCGHEFHDECIVPALNETLRCPTCHHLEIQ